MGEYVVFLVIGALAVLLDGWVIYRSGSAVLADDYDSPAAAQAANRLVTVTFLLVLFGMLALVSVLGVGGDTALIRVVTKIGILLLLLAVAHGTAAGVFGRLRRRHRTERQLDDHDAARRTGRPQTSVTRDLPR